MQFKLDEAQQKVLLKLARKTLELSIHNATQTSLDDVYSTLNSHEKRLYNHPTLHQTASSFVTLKLPDNDGNMQLRGCIGSLQAQQALIRDVSQHAYAAAFQDPRFPPVRQHDISFLKISISVISPQQQLNFEDEPDLLAQLRPGIDGLTIESKGCKSTFLPSVWSQLPDKHLFISQLKKKAGLPGNYWSEDFRASRYEAFYFQES
ncbi:hypothetical protein TDB9533_00395 [Thalassocella blandensis]|nr:hypothetical protein TDB9533_00395 [Thalassocella blandensis]